MSEPLYFDSNATARLRPEVRASYLEALERVRGNPASLHGPGRNARHMLDEARGRLAAALGVHEDELLFTSGGTESNNLALLGALRARGRTAGLAVSSIEHASVLGPARALERAGHPLLIIEVDETGSVRPASLHAALAAPATALVSTMAANNELGTCSPLAEIAAALERAPRRPFWHVDAVQALGRVPLDLRGLGIDLASFSLHKVGAPVGVGLLYRRSGVALEPLMYGGEQEQSLRPGTENVAGAVAAATAVELALAELAQNRERLAALAVLLWGQLVIKLPHLKLLGLPIDHPRRLPGTLNILSQGLEGKVLVMRLDLAGVAASAGSACASGSLEPSHVLKAIGCCDDEARSGLRLSCGHETRAEDVHRLVESLWRTLRGRT
ncbi:MAG: aminotransferase class V-fold PLP-dependent enzyme [Planctomycetes bacterium]|nr:aminotransferase class V-fold PLP-dependent enzyme [Planctomycetota bacterium]